MQDLTTLASAVLEIWLVRAHQNLNGFSDLTTPLSLSGMLCHPWVSIYYDQPICTKFEVSMSSLSTTKIRKTIQNIENMGGLV